MVSCSPHGTLSCCLPVVLVCPVAYQFLFPRPTPGLVVVVSMSSIVSNTVSSNVGVVSSGVGLSSSRIGVLLRSMSSAVMFSSIVVNLPSGPLAFSTLVVWRCRNFFCCVSFIFLNSIVFPVAFFCQ